MVAETLTGVRAKGKFGVGGHGYATTPVMLRGYYDIAANVEDGDIFEMVKVPAGFLLVGGHLAAADLDTGTEALDLDLGWAANGTASAATLALPWGESYADSGNAASATGIINGAVFSGDGVTDVFAAGVNWRPIILPTALWFAAPTMIQVEANAAAATFAAGRLSVVLLGEIHMA
jgi:hypothetical protein